MKRLLASPLGLTAVILLGLVLLDAALAPIIWGEAAQQVDTGNILAPPSAAHWVGTDQLGRDLVLRTLVAGRVSVLLALLATAIAVLLGLALGAAPLLLGRRLGHFITAAVNVAVAFPGLLLALFFAVIFGVGQVGAVLAIGLAGAPSFARLCQTLIAAIREREFIAAARIAGLSRWRILYRHVLPNIAEPLIVNATIGAGSCLLSFSGLSFLGLGVQPPAYDWGRLMNEGLNRIYLNPLAALFPGLAVVLAGLAFNLTGEAVARVFRIATGTGLGGAGVRPQRLGTTNPPVALSGLAEVADETTTVLRVRGLRVSFPGAAGEIRPVRGLSFDVRRGEAVGLVGESGAGKSLTGLAVAQLIEAPGAVTADELTFLGHDLQAGRSADQRHLLGTKLALVFQDPRTSLNPVQRVGKQLAELAQAHEGLAAAAAWARAEDRLEAVKIPQPQRRARQYPHEFSGGMRQRAMIGLGLMASPALIIADEPTTALDVTVQRQVLDLLAAIRRDSGVALILISHDVAVIAERCDRVLVMYAGQIVEDLGAADLSHARHPYTRLLLAAVPDLTTPVDQPLAVIPGRPLEPSQRVEGCGFAGRCPLATARCHREEPPLAPYAADHRLACWRPAEPLPELGDDVPDLAAADSDWEVEP